MEIDLAIKKGAEILRRSFIKTSLLDSEILMSKVINKKREQIILNPKENLKEKYVKLFYDLIHQRTKGRPIAYITGRKNFWKYDFLIKNKVLIPRPDTEILIEQALELTKYQSKLRILDIGIGSGCLLLSILKERKNFTGLGVDINKNCIELSKLNALKLGIKNRVKFLKSNVDNLHCGKYDLVISNPPYIKKLDLKYLEKDVKDFEPMSALNGGIDGTSEIRKIVNKSSELIKKNGKFILEISFDQKLKVTKLLKEKGFYINKTLKDLANNDRCIISTKKF